ncbi:NUDIX hydrolase [Joostella sp. CR20]|uniref:NUDIX hydrolase n=1 Tax=Joostella sp. CR20 TaxID=2804312 RepID=UPI00313BE2CA
MDELVDILDSEGNPTGKTLLKSEAHQKGLFHPTVHVWMYTDEKQVLLQKRAPNKDTYPNKWDVSVAGHISAGETPEVSAVREVQEEIGLTISENDLEKVGVLRSSVVHSKTIIDCEFHHIYIVKLKQSLKTLQLQESEVTAIKLVAIEQYLKELQDFEFMQNYVPKTPNYIDLVFSEIRRKTR